MSDKKISLVDFQSDMIQDLHNFVLQWEKRQEKNPENSQGRILEIYRKSQQDTDIIKRNDTLRRATENINRYKKRQPTKWQKFKCNLWNLFFDKV